MGKLFRNAGQVFGIKNDFTIKSLSVLRIHEFVNQKKLCIQQ